MRLVACSGNQIAATRRSANILASRFDERSPPNRTSAGAKTSPERPGRAAK